MADEKIVTSIVATSDFSNLIADVQRVTSSLFKLQQEFAGANRALSGQIDAANAMFEKSMLKTGQFSSHFVSLTSDVEKFGKNLDGGRLKLNDYFRTYREHVRTSGGLIRDLAKQQVQLQNAVLQPLGRNAQGLMQYNVHIPRGLDLTKNKAAILKQELQIMNKVIQDGGVQLINWGKNTQWAGRQLTVGLTLPLVAFGKAAADAFKVADQELTRLTKVYGDVAGTSAAELSKIRKDVSATAKELSSAMGVNFAETISLAADIAATGKTGNELLSSVSETTRLAVLGEVDRQEAMKATLAIQSAFKSNTEELAESINFLNAVENQTSTTLNDLVEAIPKAGPVIKGLGGDIEDLALYLTAMREGGINASEGANALKSALASLINPTDVAVKKFQGFGIDLLGIVGKNAGDVTATLFALQSALDRLDPLQKQQAIEQLFGKFQFSRLNALFENLGRQGSQTLQVLDLMQASAAQLEAVAGRELTAVTESAAGRYKRAVESLKADMAGVGDQFLDIATKFINVLNKVIDFGQKLPDPIKKLLAFGGAFTAIIGPVIMLTGVLANFFGYIIKGLGHFKALFKGAEGFKLLTPEILAAKAAGGQLSDEFYSDALAADTLRVAIKKLAEDLVFLQKNAVSAKTAASGLGQVMTTMGGTPLMTVGGQRVADPLHPLIGPKSRAAAHLNPRDPNNPATIFGLTMQPIPVNRKIGANPQILMTERLEDVEGLTTIGGVSTGVVAGEHARYAALMATLGLQSKKEIEDLKKTIRMGGQVSSEFMATFDDILPITQQLSANAAAQSASIVAELNAGKLSVAQARAAIIAVNAQLERDLGISVTAYGASRGRTIDLTKTPLIDQPVVDPTGKPNTRGMFRKGIFAKVMAAVGRATNTKTLGGPYSIETTRPTGYNMGGRVKGYIGGGGVYTTDGFPVPGPNVNADVVPAMLTPGEFVLTNDTVAREGSDRVQALHEGRATIVPIEDAFQANSGGMVPGVQYRFAGGPILKILSALKRWNPSGARSLRRLYDNDENPSTRSFTPKDFEYGPVQYAQIEKKKSKSWGAGLLASGKQKDDEVLAHVFSSKFRRQFKGVPTEGSAPVLTGAQLLERFGTVPTSRKGIESALLNRYQVLPDNVVNVTKSFNSALSAGTAKATDWLASGRKPQHLVSLISHLVNSGVPEPVAYRVAARTMTRINKAMESIAKKEKLHKLRVKLGKPSTPPKTLNEDNWGNIVNDATKREIDLLFESYQKGSAYAFNRGGTVPGSRTGRVIRRPYGYARGVQNKLLGGAILRMLAPLVAMFGGQALGSKIGGTTGTAVSTASSILPFLMMPDMSFRQGVTPGQRLGFSGASPISPLRQSIFAQSTPLLGKFATQMGDTAIAGNGLMKVLAKIGVGLTRLNVIVGTVLLVGGKLVSMWKDAKNAGDLAAASFGLNSEAAQKAGLKYTDYRQKVKDAAEAQKLFLDQNKLTYQNMALANTPFRITISEYKKLRKEVKETMGQQIEILNSASNQDVARVVVQIKEQLVGAGLSAQEATKKIYALLQLSNKSSLTVSAMSSRRFAGITSPETATLSSLETFNIARDLTPKIGDAKAELNAFNSAMTLLDNSVQNMYDKSAEAARKKNEDFNQTLGMYDAEQKQLDLITSKMGAQREIGDLVYAQLVGQDAQLAKFINTQDTVVSVWQKIRIATRGYTGDLERLNVQQTDQLYRLTTQIAKAVVEVNSKGLLKDQYAEYNRLYDLQKKLATAAKGQSVKDQIDARDAIRAIDKKIKKINEEAEARKKALREEAQAEDVALRVQKQRLEYEKRLSSGDLTGAAEAQLELQRILNEQQILIAEQAIEDKRQKDVAPLEKQKERLQREQEKMADNAALAAENLQTVTEKLNKQKDKIDAVNDAMTALKLNVDINRKDLEKYKQTAEFKGLVANFIDAAQKAGIRTPEFNEYTYTDGGKPVLTGDANRANYALGLLDNANISINSILAQKDIIITTNGTVRIDGKKIDFAAEGSLKNPFNFGTSPWALNSWSNPLSKGPSSVREMVKSLAETKGVESGEFFTLKDNSGKTYVFRRRADGNITMVDDPYDNKAMGGQIKRYSGGATDGPVKGEGTGTSDSIVARVSNGEYVTKAVSVSDIGVNNMHLINTKGAQGLIEAARNIVGENKAMGGLIGYSMGGQIPSFAIGGFGRRLFGKFGEMIVKATAGIRGGIKNTFDDVMDSLGMGMKDPADAFPMDPQLAKQALEEAIDNATRNKMILPQLPNNLKQAKYLAKMYKEHSRFWQKEAKKYKGNPQTVGEFNDNLRSGKKILDSEPRIIDHNPMVKDWKDFVANVEPSDFAKPRSPLDKEFFDIVSNPEVGVPADRGFISKGLEAPDLFSGINAPETLSLYDYYLGKVSENKLIESVYRDITKIIASDPLLARKLGLINPKGMAYGGLVGYPMGGLIPYNKGGKVKKPNLLNRIDSALGGLANKENWEQTANFFALPEIGRSLQDVIKYGNPMNAAIARLAGGQMKSSISDNLIAASFGIPVGKIPGVSKGLSWLGSKFANFGVAADQKLVAAFSKISGSKPTIPTVATPKVPKLGKLHADFVRAHPQEKNFIYYLLSNGVEPDQAARLLAMRRGGLDWRPPKTLVQSTLWESPTPSAIAAAEAKFAQQKGIFEDAMLLYPFARGEKQFDKLGKQLADDWRAPVSSAKGLSQDTGKTGEFVDTTIDILKRIGVSGEYDSLVNYILARQSGMNKGLSLFESTTAANIDQDLVKRIASIVSEKGFIDTSKFKTAKTILEDNTIIDERPTRGVHAALMRVLRDNAGTRYFEKTSHPDLPIKTSYMELFNELYGSKLAGYLGIPSPKNKLGFKFGDILSPAILSEDFSKYGWQTVIDRQNTGASILDKMFSFSNPGGQSFGEIVSNLGYKIPSEELLAPQLAEDLGRMAGFVGLIKSLDTFQNPGNMLFTKEGARLGALDFGFSFDKHGPIPDFFTKTEEVLKLKPNFESLLHTASFGQYTNKLTDEELLKNIYKGLFNVAGRVGNTSNIKKIIDLTLKNMTEARPNLDLRLPVELAEQMSSLVTIFKDKSLGKLAVGGYINPTYSANMSIPSFGDGVNNIYGDMIAKVHENEAIIPAKFNPWNPTASNPLGGSVSINMPLTVNAAPGMDEDYLINRAAIKVQEVIDLALTKSGRPVNVSRRYAV